MSTLRVNQISPFDNPNLIIDSELNVTGGITATTFYGDGSNLTGLNVSAEFTGNTYDNSINDLWVNNLHLNEFLTISSTTIPDYDILLKIHQPNDNPWAIGLFNDSYSGNQMSFGAFVWNDGKTSFGTEIDKSLEIYINADYFNPTVTISSDGVNINNSITAVTYYGDGSHLSGIIAGEAINVTHSELYDLIVTQSLIPNSTYRLTDYKSFNFINGWDSANANQGPRNIPAGRLFKEFTETLISENNIFNDNINSFDVSNEKIVVGGKFTLLGDKERNYLVRLLPDGTEDTDFYNNLGSGIEVTFQNRVNIVKINVNTRKILVGGKFDQFNGNQRHNLIRLNEDGTEDSDFYNNLGGSFNGTVTAIEIQSDNKILVGGEFDTFNGVERQRIVRLNDDGTEDTDFYNNLGSGFTIDCNAINSIKVDPISGQILVGGEFVTFNGNERKRLIRLNDDGTEDTDFYDQLGSSFEGTILTLDIQSDNYILVGGEFTTFNGLSRNCIVRLRATGQEDTDFYGFLTSSGNNNGFFDPSQTFISIVKELSSGKILVGGKFTSLNGFFNKNIVQLYTEGYYDDTFKSNVGLDNYTNSDDYPKNFIELNDSILIGGHFTTYQDLDTSRLLKIYKTETTSNYNAREIHMGETEVLLLKSISNYQFDPVVLSETYPQDVLDYKPYCNNLGFYFDLYNGKDMPDSSTLSGFDLQWDGENVYFEMPSGFTTQYGHYFYLYSTFYNGLEYYYVNLLFEPLTPIRSKAQYTYSPSVTDEITINSGGTKVILANLTYQNYLDYQSDTLYVETIDPTVSIRGWVTKRVDNFRNISIPFDFRNFKFRRYQVDLSSISPLLYVGGYYGITDYFKNRITTGNYRDSKTFNDEYNDVYDFIWDDIGGPDGGDYYNGFSDNVVFTDSLIDSSFKKMRRNTIYGIVTSNEIGVNFRDNIVVGNMTRNKIGDESYYNIFKTFYENSIGDYFYNNKIDNNFTYNKIGKYFTNNTIGGNFSFNSIENSFGSNSIGESFKFNKIGNYFYNNSISDGFGFGSSSSQGNVIGNYFNYNNIGEYFYNNIISDGFYANTIGNYFQLNNITYGLEYTNFLSSTHVYGNYNCQIFKNSNSTYRLSYYDNTDSLVITDITN